MTITFTFTQPDTTVGDAEHHAAAAILNEDVATEAIEAVMSTVRGATAYKRILLRAAAGAGKSHTLKRMVRETLDSPHCRRVAIAVFANKQIYPLVRSLGETLGQENVCFLSGKARFADVPDDVKEAATVVTSTKDIPEGATVVLATSHRFGAPGERGRLTEHLGVGENGELPFDVLFVDEAWQMARYLFSGIERLAPVAVGVGDVGQLPPLDGDNNPWRGDEGYNPYRAWPDTFPGDDETWSRELPTVWRPRAEQLPLWRAFYTDWQHLTCVMAPGDRTVTVTGMSGQPDAVWHQVGSGVPTLLEVEGLPEPEAPDIDPDLLGVVGELLEAVVEGGLTFGSRSMVDGEPRGELNEWSTDDLGDGGEHPAIVILATRNAAVDDAHRLVERLTAAHNLPDGFLVASTVDSWQGQTNAVTIAIHPLSGAEGLDEFNSAFGRLAVVCTRATHGLLLVTRSGIHELLEGAAARPGTPLGEPGVRQLPRQTHERILGTFARGTWVAPSGSPALPASKET